MANKLLLLAIIFIIGFGCGLGDRVRRAAEGETNSANTNTNKTLTDHAVDTAVGESKIGIPDCDEVMDLIQAELNNPDDNFVTKAIKSTVLNRIKDGIRESVEESRKNNSNTNNNSSTTANRNSNNIVNTKNTKSEEELTKTCREFRVQFDKYKAEELKKAEQQ